MTATRTRSATKAESMDEQKTDAKLGAGEHKPIVFTPPPPPPPPEAQPLPAQATPDPEASSTVAELRAANESLQAKLDALAAENSKLEKRVAAADVKGLSAAVRGFFTPIPEEKDSGMLRA